ncbi:ATP-binding protein [Streptosporangium sp. NPDC002524]|uniref:ATP-binding protein n=1 Tax=Streptosporangium sp. NPDC002524 TaxID=3154537 RepID=UPI00332DB94B
MTGDHGQHWPIDEDLSALRDRLEYHAARAGMRGERLDDLLLVTNEAVINILEHGGGKGTLAIWQNETYLTVDVTDTLGLLTIWHVPSERPTGTVRGFGLWLMNQLCDEFTIDQVEEGSRVRLRMRIGSPATRSGASGSADSARDDLDTTDAPDPVRSVADPVRSTADSVRGAADSARDDPGQGELQVSF